MTTFTIPEININKLERRINTLKKKCEKYQYTFSYEKVKEVYEDFISPEGYKVTEKCYLVKLSGEVLHEGWTLVAKIEKVGDNNLIHRFTHEFKIPEKYYYTDLTCDHCQSKRNRKYTYLLKNQYGEWLQVGTGCVSEFTNGGLNVEDIAYFAQTFDFARDCQKIETEVLNTRKFEASVELEEALSYSYREITLNGYTKSSEEDSTKEIVMNMLSSLSTPEPTSTERCFANDCIRYFREEVDYTHSEYLNNLHTIASNDYVEMKYMGYVVAMMNTYIKFLNDSSKKEENNEIVQEYLGEVGDRLDIKTKDWKCLYHELNLFGDIYLYRFVTDGNRVVTWATSKRLEDRHILAIKGTVKEHLEYKGEKQTKLTRCKVTYK